jgi:hypothetical protein
MQVRRFVKGDRLTLLYATLQDGAGTAVDLTGQIITFYMKNTVDGTIKVNGATATVEDVLLGTIYYSWAEADIDTVGKYWGWFVRTVAGLKGTHPVGEQFMIEIVNGPV